MNFLAHAYLSFNSSELLVGNMISDFVKGKKKFEYATGIQKGIALHRAIDAFTDDHWATKEARQFFKPSVGAYSGAFVDVMYDHFLANDLSQFSNERLHVFAIETYTTLEDNKSILPTQFAAMLPFMISQNWLYNYKSTGGIDKSFGGVVRRAKYLTSHHEAFSAFEKHYVSLQKCYNNFFPELKAFASQYSQSI